MHIPDWITWPGTLGFLGGLVAIPLVWFLSTFFAEPIKRYRQRRGDVILALNRYARYVISEADTLDDATLFDFALKSPRGQREGAGIEFDNIGHRIMAFARNERLATGVLRG
jgi:hypothetical protein